MNGITISRLVKPRQVVVYAPLGAQTRFRRATRATLVADNVLGGVVTAMVVRVDGEGDFTVPAGWIDPPGAPEPQPAHRCVVVDFATRRVMSAPGCEPRA